jgi:hypothetical protein
MDTLRSDDPALVRSDGLSRRKALLRAGAGGLAAALLGAAGLRRGALAQDATPMAAPAGWRSQRLEVSVAPHDPVSITLAGSGPPQRGDHFYIDAPIYASGDEGGAEIGIYRCFGAWTAAADNTTAPVQRFTTVQFVLFQDGVSIIMGLINEGGSDPSAHTGAVQGGTGAYAGALGTFTQVIREGAVPGAQAGTADATPVAGPTIVDAGFDLLLPGQG